MFDFEFLPITLLYYHPFGIRADSVTTFSIIDFLFSTKQSPGSFSPQFVFKQRNILVALSVCSLCSMFYVPCSMFHRGFSECGLCPLFSILLHFCKLIFHNFRLLPCNDSNSLLNDVYEKTFG